ncbi:MULTISPECIES: sugar ABC transporter permease [Burkholderiaceae]|uniref:carbohydrate ABC transporter permease n=1 Tax=Burkholderiaceae TaxID=119060 RepID=UPI00141E8222|nr:MULTISPECIES: sugar ABC transporter permease [Burkholderiaceae]MBN3845984.1 sugar ABC transporter permease [Paraburkholderia sp. Ac-20342]NIF54123.1 sugar ABC transporter permease [Burkholderia sp. Ax-1724]NIF77764.1 sugar ABC transporter permease [Paraburkholderia sp. Cy-641]
MAKPLRASSPALALPTARPSRTPVIVLFAGPAVLLGLATLILPLVAVIVLAFTDYRLGASHVDFIGLQNFASLAHDPVLQRSFANTLLYTALVVPASTVLGLGLALLIDARTSLRSLYRTLHFLPVMAATIAIAVVWEFMLHPSFGLVNLLLARVGIAGPHWLEDPRTALLSLALIGIWQATGFNMVLFLTGLTGIPAQYREAAAVDGAASGWTRFWLVTWPLLRPITGFVVVISTIRSFQLFETVYVITGGGPQKSTEVLLFTMFSEAFEFFRTGRGAAIAVLFLLLVGVLTLVKFRFSSDRSAS